jgi:putative hydrolase of the HAD superfamily
MVGGVIEAVLLDVGGVFFVPEHAPLEAALRRFGAVPTAEDLDRGHYAGIAAVDKMQSLDWSAYHLAVAENCGVVAPHGDEAAASVREAMAVASWRRLLPGSLEGLRRLAATGVRLAIVSNSDGNAEAGLVGGAVCQVGAGEGVEVHVILDSHVVGIEKPDPRIFALALDRLGGIPPDRAVHVGDTVFADVVGARAAGIRPLHLDPHRFCPINDHEHVSSLDDVVSLVLESRP